MASKTSLDSVRVADGSETRAEREGFDGNDHERVEKKEDREIERDVNWL